MGMAKGYMPHGHPFDSSARIPPFRFGFGASMLAGAHLPTCVSATTPRARPPNWTDGRTDGVAEWGPGGLVL